MITFIIYGKCKASPKNGWHGYYSQIGDDLQSREHHRYFGDAASAAGLKKLSLMNRGEKAYVKQIDETED